jgi:hypothetical protein
MATHAGTLESLGYFGLVGRLSWHNPRGASKRSIEIFLRCLPFESNGTLGPICFWSEGLLLSSMVGGIATTSARQGCPRKRAPDADAFKSFKILCARQDAISQATVKPRGDLARIPRWLL